MKRAKGKGTIALLLSAPLGAAFHQHDLKCIEIIRPAALPAPELNQCFFVAAVSSSYSKLNKMNEAVRILDAIICQAPDECQNVMNYIAKTKCLLQLEKVEEAVDVITQLEMILQSNRNLTNLKGVAEQVISGIQELIEHFIVQKCFNTTIQLVKCKFHVVKFFCENDNERLVKCEETGALVERLCRESLVTAKNCGKDKADKPKGKEKNDMPRILLEALLQEMLLIKEVPVEEKAVKVGWVYKYFGFYYEELKQHARAVEMYKQGVAIMLTVFADEGKKFKLLGHLHNGLGNCLAKLNMHPAAMYAYEKAVECFNEAEDWDNQVAKYEIINNAMKIINSYKSKCRVPGSEVI